MGACIMTPKGREQIVRAVVDDGLIKAVAVACDDNGVASFASANS